MAETDIMITFETLYDLLRREKTRQEIQKLDENFYKDLAKYISEKKDILESQKQKESVFTQQEIKKTQNQIDSILKIIRELYEIRENKIIQVALINSRTKSENETVTNLVPEEEDFYKLVIQGLNQFRSNILHSVQNSNPPTIIKKEEPKDIKRDEKPQNIKFIRFIETVPKFVGSDLQVYGPFEKEDVANLPINVVTLLIKNNRAEEI
ncbi:MAG: hypothetical protein KKH88_04720 [Nanoarchaeota archaeon]|nr:hypothetical protein [Nanoarchaeota archaeon]MBU1444945.1 hypothetical protein [Nanoarchaeota archaeon]MBU2420433.1 hypothetical protein [Nanoarchaeota archaeon]MBU2475699.1 hypothetical protein [Nanoarchaeota archaeon]MBU3941203.1 hypothetical protein [Nanoarchaeota archaeon]